MKAPDAKQVSLVTELFDEPIAMQKDSTGVWEVETGDHVNDTFTYYFLVDGTPVADPQNMYLAPQKGFKPSVCDNPSNVYTYNATGEKEHGTVRYNVAKDEACYIPAGYQEGQEYPMIVLLPGDEDTVESWFKIGGADVMADKLIAQGKIRPVIIVSGNQGKAIATLRADDYKTWPERRKALETILLQQQ